MSAAASYRDRARSKRSAQASLIPPEWRLQAVPSVEDAPDAVAYIQNSSNKLLSPRELAITEISDINALLRKLASRQLSSLEVTKAFAKRAALLHQLTTCCTEIFFEDAFTRAAQLDDHLRRTGETVGPLHGLPVSIKDLFGVEGVDTCIGTLKSQCALLKVERQKKKRKLLPGNRTALNSNRTGLAKN
jgi:amidase